MTTNATSDYLTPRALNRASKAFIGWSGSPGTSRPNPHDEYSEPIRVPSDWWADVAENVVDEVMIWGGGGEVLIDGIRAYAGTMAEGFAMADAGIATARTSAAARRSASQKKNTEDAALIKEAAVSNVEMDAADAARVSGEEAVHVEGVEPKDFGYESKHAIETIEEQKEPTQTAAAEEKSYHHVVDIDDAATRKRLGTERVFYVETPRAAHEEQIFRYVIKGEAGPSATVVEDWIRSRV